MTAADVSEALDLIEEFLRETGHGKSPYCLVCLTALMIAERIAYAVIKDEDATAHPTDRIH
jgi:hypothetical protein